MSNPFSWDYLTAGHTSTPTWGPFSVFYVVLFGLTFIGALYVYFNAPHRFQHHRPWREFALRTSSWALWVTGIGLLFFGIRFLDFAFLTLERRIWMYLAFAALLAVAAFFFNYYRTTLQQQLAALERARERRRWTQPATARRSGSKNPSRRTVR